MKCTQPNRGEKYWFLNGDGDVWKAIWKDSVADGKRFRIGNVFLTESAAETHRDLLHRIAAEEVILVEVPTNMKCVNIEHSDHTFSDETVGKAVRVEFRQKFKPPTQCYVHIYEVSHHGKPDDSRHWDFLGDSEEFYIYLDDIEFLNNQPDSDGGSMLEDFEGFNTSLRKQESFKLAPHFTEMDHDHAEEDGFFPEFAPF